MRRWKLILGLCALFIAGMVFGAIVALQCLKRQVTERSTARWWVKTRLAECDRRLQLTPEQRARIKPIVDDAGREFEGMASDAISDVVGLLSRTNERISQELNPAQQEELKKLERDALSRWQDFIGSKRWPRQKSAAPESATPEAR